MRVISRIIEGRDCVIGECVRRVVHLSFAFIPFCYFSWIVSYSDHFRMYVHLALVILVLFCLALDGIRIRQQWVVLGSRCYESQRLSSMTFMIFGVIVVLCLSPNKYIATAIIVSVSVVDPVMGIMRRCSVSLGVVFGVGVCLVFLIWTTLAADAHMAVGWIFFISVITVWVEYFQWRLLDDNLLMQMVPLGVALCLVH